MLLEAQLAAFVGAALLLGAFIMAHQRFPSDFSGYWIAGWSFYVLRFGFDSLGTVFGGGPLLTFTTNVAVATSAILLFLAVVQIEDRDRSYTREALFLWVALVGWSGIAVGFDVGFLYTYTPLYVAFGLIQLVTAYLFYQYLSQYDYSSTPFIVASLVIWGLHKFNYPLLRPLEGVAPYGYVFGALLSFTTGLGVVMFLLEDAERKATKERNVAKRRYDEFEALFDNIPDPVFIHDLDGQFLKVNETAIETLGYSAAELRSMTPHDIVAPDEATEIEERILRAGTEAVVTFDSTHVTAEGKHIDVSVNAAQITYRGEDAILAVARDVTDRQLLKQRLSVVNRILRHDIRSAVNVIKGNAEMAKVSTRDPTEPLRTVTEEADRLLDIAEAAQKIEQLQEEEGSSTDILDVSAVVQANAAKIRRNYSNVSITTTVPTDLSVEVTTGFSEAIENVLSNAVIHNDKDEVRITVTAEPAAGNVVLRIADNGPGIPVDEIKPLEAGQETELQHASGLGLWFVNWIIEESSGRMTFEANEPTGTIVELVVPRAEAE